jgi:hypothetical protein
MKYQEFPAGRGLPDAPLAMPKQSLERDRSLIDVLFGMFLSWQRR